MFQDVIEQEIYQRARLNRLTHDEALQAAREQAPHTRAVLARAQAAQADKENPQPAFSWARYEQLAPLASASLDAALARQQAAFNRAARIDTEIAALDKDIAERPDPRQVSKRALLDEKGRL
jgi:hypothetical protein